MPEQSVASVLAQSRGVAWSMIAVLPLCGIATGAAVQNVPASLRACTAEADSARRLACYDRAMARRSAPPSPSPQSAAAAPPARPDLPARVPAIQTPQPSQRQPAAAPASQPEPASDEASLSHRASAAWKALAGSGPGRVTAHVAHLDRSPDSTVLHLDNGQVWRQVGRATGDLSLRTGDSVTIEKHLGSYWLSSRYVSNMKVRLQSPQPQ